MNGPQHTWASKPAAPEKRRCHRCHGSGRVHCQFCGGSGKLKRSTDFFGNVQFETCTACFGLKHTRCKTCAGEGFL